MYHSPLDIYIASALGVGIYNDGMMFVEKVLCELGLSVSEFTTNALQQKDETAGSERISMRQDGGKSSGNGNGGDGLQLKMLQRDEKVQLMNLGVSAQMVNC